MFATLESILISYAQVLPLPLFAAVSSFVEEIIAPIPSGPVMLVMGSLASVQGYTLLGLAGLTLAAALGKLAGSLVVYTIADKTEDVFSGRITAFFGITHAQIERLGAKLGNGWKDYLFLTTLRALPFIPSVVLSFGAGVLKVPLRLFIVATFIGSLIRDALFLYVGYLGLKGAEEILGRVESLQTIVEIVIVLGIVIGAGYLYYLHRKRSRAKKSRLP